MFHWKCAVQTLELFRRVFSLSLENVATITELITFANCFISMYSYKWKTHTISTIIKCWNNQDLTFNSAMWWAEGKESFEMVSTLNAINLSKNIACVCASTWIYSNVTGVELLHRVWSFAIYILVRPSMLFKPLLDKTRM